MRAISKWNFPNTNIAFFRPPYPISSYPTGDLQWTNASRSRFEFAGDITPLRIVRNENACGQGHWGCGIEFGCGSHGHRRIPRHHTDQYILLGENTKIVIQTKTISGEAASGGLCECELWLSLKFGFHIFYQFHSHLQFEMQGYYKDTVEFFFEGRNECKNFWKKCVENHGFFRCTAVQSLPRRKTRVLSRGSSFRYQIQFLFLFLFHCHLFIMFIAPPTDTAAKLRSKSSSMFETIMWNGRISKGMPELNDNLHWMLY